MATKHKNPTEASALPKGDDMKLGVVVSDWNNEITDRLLEGCERTLRKAGVPEEKIRIVRVPGSYELPMGARILAGSESWDAIICIGCVIKGETKHDEYIANAVSAGLMQLSLMSNTPVIFGVLTPNNMKQALERSGGELGNKGEEAAEAALRMAALRKENTSSKGKIGFV